MNIRTKLFLPSLLMTAVFIVVLALLFRFPSVKSPVALCGAGGILAILFLNFMNIDRTVKPIDLINEGLSDVSDQVSSASIQVLLASQSLSEGAMEQEAALDETAGSMKKMAGIVAHNSENVKQMERLMNQANTAVKNAHEAMNTLMQGIDNISRTSEETSKIVNSIDEIAFQTHLLALNAAVEAARVGDAGAGFAVVAGEVKRLATRSAEAANSTADLIEDTTRKITDVTGLVQETHQAFLSVTEKSDRISELIGDVSSGFREQAGGIEDVNQAMGRLDMMIYQNASNTEETTSAAERMSVQSEKLKGFIRRLMGLSEQRRHMRAQMMITGTIHDHGKGTSHSFVTKNLSVGGALVSTAASLEPASEISLKLHYSEIDIPEIKAKVASSRGKINEKEYAYGLEFRDVGDNLEELLKNMLYLGE